MATVPLHPACEALPGLPPERYRELVESIRQHGLEDPIVRHGGAILDGRHRFRACSEIGVEPRFVEWDGRGGDPVGFIALKQIRRDMTDDQRAAWAVRYVMPAEKAKARAAQAHGRTAPGKTLERESAQASERRPPVREKVADARGFRAGQLPLAGVLALAEDVDADPLLLRLPRYGQTTRKDESGEPLVAQPMFWTREDAILNIAAALKNRDAVHVRLLKKVEWYEDRFHECCPLRPNVERLPELDYGDDG